MPGKGLTFVVVLISQLCCGLVEGEDRRQRSAKAALLKLGVGVGNDEVENIVSLYFRSLRQTDAILEDLSDFPLHSVRRLVFVGEGISDQGLEHVQHWIHLEELYLVEATDVTDDGIAALFQLGVLKTLCLRRTQIGNEGARTLARLTNLVALDLTGTEVGDEGLDSIANLPLLKSLSMASTPVTDKGTAAVITRLHGLGELDLSDTEIGDRTLLQLKSLTGLYCLKLRKTLVSDHGLAHLRELPLESLDLRGTAVSARCLASLPKETLEVLYLPGEIRDADLTFMGQMPKLRWLHLDAADISASGFEELAKVESMETLIIDNFIVEDEDVAGLSSLTKLKSLHIGKCRLSVRGAERLTHALPKTVVTFEDR